MANPSPPYGPPTAYPPPYYVAPPPRARGRLLLLLPAVLFLIGGAMGALAFLILGLTAAPVWWDLL